MEKSVLFDSIVNTPTSCTTQNFFLQGKKCVLHLDNNELFLSIDGDVAQHIEKPQTIDTIVTIKADNNRLCILGKDRETNAKELWWCCVQEDKARWVEYVFAIADIISSQDTSSNADADEISDGDKLLYFLYDHIDDLHGLLVQGLDNLKSVVDLGVSLSAESARINETIAAIKQLPKTSEEMKVRLKQLLNSLFTLFLSKKVGGSIPFLQTTYEQFDSWVSAYRMWVETSHKPFTWNKLERKQILVSDVNQFRSTDTGTLSTKPISLTYDIDLNAVSDIAVGNWHQTVATYYVLISLPQAMYQDIFGTLPEKPDRTSVILFCDEEPMMANWKIVPGTTGDPYPFSDAGILQATCSIVTCLDSSEQVSELHWIRYDFHNFEDFSWFPLNWTEHFFNRPFDVDTIRLKFNDTEKKKLRDFVLKVLFDIFKVVSSRKKNNAIVDNLLAIFKETREHHPGWHRVELPDKNIVGFRLRSVTDTPWPVPSVNIFMYYLLVFSRLGDLPRTTWDRFLTWTDMVFDLLDLLYTNAEKETNKANRIFALTQKMGFLGENPIIPSYKYPVSIMTKTNTGAYYTISGAWSTLVETAQWTPHRTHGLFALQALFADNHEKSDTAQQTTPIATTFHTARQELYDIRFADDFTISIIDKSNMFLAPQKEAKNTLYFTNAPDSSFICHPKEIGLRAFNGKFVDISHHWWKSLHAIKTWLPQNGVLSIEYHSPSRVSLKTAENYYVTTFWKFWHGVFALGVDIAPINTFTLITMGNGYYAFKTNTGRYLSVGKWARLNAGATRIGQQEIFKFSFCKTLLQSSITGNFVTNNNGILAADGTSLSTASPFLCIPQNIPVYVFAKNHPHFKITSTEIALQKHIRKEIPGIISSFFNFLFGKKRHRHQQDFLSNALLSLCHVGNGDFQIYANTVSSLGIDSSQKVCLHKIADDKHPDLFKIVPQTLFIKAANNRYLCAEGGGGARLIANKEYHKSWETFTITYSRTHSAMALKSKNKTFVICQDSGEVSVTGLHVDKQSLFTVEWLYYNRIALRTYRGTYLQITGDGQIVAHSKVIDEASTFEIQFSEVALLAPNDRYIAENKNNDSLYAKEISLHRGQTFAIRASYDRFFL